MSNPISAVQSISGLEQLQLLKAPGQSSSPGDFQSLLKGTMQNLQGVGNSASEAVQQFLNGENEELHSTVLAVQKAALTFDLGLQIRNKVVAAYQEIMRMQM